MAVSGVRARSIPLAARVVLPVALILAPCAAARADFGDCASTEYVESFDPRLAADPFGCVERMRTEVSTAHGTRHIRVVEGFAADWAYEPGYPAAVERGVRATAEALSRLGAYRVDDVTVLLVDDLPAFDPGERDRSHMLASAVGAPQAGECRVAMYPLARGDTDFVAFTVAHELFHCVQYATAGRERVLTLSRGEGAGGDWWVESSAEWFAELAVPGTGELADRVAAFDATSVDTPLYEMSYEAVVFFLWLAGERGEDAVTRLFPRMADSASAEAQRAAMRGILSDEEWLEFAQAYLDRGIVGPGGDPIGSRPVGRQILVEEPAPLELTLEPFVLGRRMLHFLCGRWRLRTAPAGANLESREPGGEWGPVPPRVNAQDLDDNDHLLAVVNTASDAAELALEIEVEASCEPCGEVDEVDSCLVGTWRQSGGGAIEWIRRQLPPDITIPRFEQSGSLFVFRADGTYLTAPVEVEMSVRARTAEGVARGEGGAVSWSAGRWSAHEGTLTVCPDAESVRGAMTVTHPEGISMTAPMVNPEPGRTAAMRYTCGEARLETSIRFPTSPDPLTTVHSRVETEEATPDEGPLMEVR